MTPVPRYPMRSRLPLSVCALLLFGGCALFFLTPGSLFGGAVGTVLGILSAGIAAVAGLAVVNLVRHEGWAVVLADDALELPAAPYRSSRRDRLPYAAIARVALWPAPPHTPTTVVVHVGPGPQVRWINQADLRTGSVAEIARLLVERVDRSRGGAGTIRTPAAGSGR
jgi:hypothetical protein